jgi:hypothetical protein
MTDGTAFSGDDELGYERSRTRFADGEPLRLDASYRLAHLPLLDPDHPLAIAREEGSLYLNGSHPTAWSVVLPVDPDELDGSAPLRRLERELRGSSFAAKIAWDLLPRRRDVLHATVCGGFGQGPPPAIHESTRRRLREIGPIEIELRGLFSGDRNVGRLYLRVYPESRAGTNALRLAQEALGRPSTDLWLVGIYNLTDNLAPAEARELEAILDAWWDVSILRFTARDLWLLAARDDLVLDGDPPILLPLTP